MTSTPGKQKEWRKLNAEHWKIYHRTYRAENIDRLREYRKEYYGTSERKLKVKENLKKYRQEHREEYNKYMREYNAKRKKEKQ